MKDLGNTSFVLDIQIDRNRSKDIVSLSHNTYIDKVLSHSDLKNCEPGDTAPVAKDDKFTFL